MGNVLSCCRKTQRRKAYNVLLLGMSGSGKTEVGTKISGKPRRDFAPSNGVQYYKRFHEDDLINITEIGGNEMYQIWHHYFVKTMGVIFTINLCDHSNFLQSLDALHNVLRHKYISGKPILVLATMADLADNIDIIELNETFGLEELANRFQSHIFLTLVGLKDTTELLEGIYWLKSHINHDYQKILNRIMFDKEDAKREKVPIVHHDERKFIRSARITFRRVGSLISSVRPHSAPNHRNRTNINVVIRDPRTYRVRSAINVPCGQRKKVRFYKKDGLQ